MDLNIIDKLNVEEKTITIAEGKTYTVECGAKTMIKAQEIFKKDNSFEAMFQVIELLLGKKAKKEIEEMNFTIKQIQVLITAIMAQVNEVPYEEMEERFQNKSK
ncbi:putative uncharacterized protein [Clostridium sp. CAG:354]|jgi:hypothetical protein|nr:hypothetical protein [Clostridium sp.]CDE11060.1 putative uncharacterized protein [Clostridium sp. CAG:354]